MDKIEEMLLELYNNENISIGVHGTGILPDKEKRKAKEILKDGLMCRYGDIRRTVALQDRGYIHAHGNISFDYLTSYKFSGDLKGYVYESQKEGKQILNIVKEIDLEQCSFILGIPKELKTIDKEIFLGDKKKFAMEYAKSKEDLRLGKNSELIGRTINPKYIIGYYMNGDISTFQHNSQFYGFKENEKGLWEIDLEKIQQENEKVKQRNEELEQKSTQELGKETLEEQKKKNFKDEVSNILNRLVGLVKGNPDRMRDD